MFLNKLVKLITAITFLVVASLTSQNALAAERTMIVLDGSGSMWGQINGQPKLVIARETLREVLKSVPDNTEIGLMAYGHRVKGDCSDIELIVPPRKASSAEIIRRVNNLNFLGKTPLSEAVKQAAEALRYTEDKATVILITDGIETCNADPCALGNSLEELGLDFTAHVVGFGLSRQEGKQVACLAENTGGKYLAAANADELAEALNQTVVKTVTQPVIITPSISLVAIDQNNEKITTIKLNWNIMDASSKSVFTTSGATGAIQAIEAGEYSVSVTGLDISGGAKFTVVADEQKQQFEIPVEMVILQATVEAPATVAANSEFEVKWTGPDHAKDYVTIVKKGAKQGKYLSYAYTSKGTPARITSPDGLGVFEIRYVHGPSKRTLAFVDIEVSAISATVKAPAKVAALATFEVEWTGPNGTKDYITIVKKGAKEGKYLSYKYTAKGSPAVITAPDGVGDYEIRYVVDASDRTLAVADIEVTAVAATVEAPKTAGALSLIEVNWTGPNASSDYITIVKKGAKEGKYLSYKKTSKGNPVTISAPDAVGAYEIRYVISASGRTLASTDIEITEISATITAPTSSPALSEITVEWVGPNGTGDYITIVKKGAKEGKYLSYKNTRKGSPSILNAPDDIGAYEIRYVVGASKRTLTSQDIVLTAVEATLKVDNVPTPGGEIIVTWTGPNGIGDYITIVEKGAPNGTYNSYSNSRKGSPAKFKVPKALGAFEVRYVIGSSKRTLASVPISLKPVSASITAPAKIAAGEPIEVTWSGPASKGDTIEIVAKGTKDNAKPISKAGTIQGSPLYIYAPEAAGEYEYRYKKKDTDKILARANLLVE